LSRAARTAHGLPCVAEGQGMLLAHKR
jgi:hypothetical protein